MEHLIYLAFFTSLTGLILFELFFARIQKAPQKFEVPRIREKEAAATGRRRSLRFLGFQKTEEGPVRRSRTAAPPQRSAEKHAKLALTTQRNSLRPLPTKKTAGVDVFVAVAG